jgi:exopolysaccharide production protein ExoZ
MTDHLPSAVPVPRRQGELVSIQYLRAVAAMMVVIHHLEPQLRLLGYAGGWPDGLARGVDIFFVISGFIMWVTTRNKNISTLDFWRRRVIRIAPLYWIITTFMVAMMLLSSGIMHRSVFDSFHVISSYLFWPAVHPTKHVLQPVVMPGWTLNYEMFFYFAFGLILSFRKSIQLPSILTFLVGLYLLGIIISPGEKNSVLSFYTNNIILEFALGIMIGVISTKSDIMGRLSVKTGWVFLMVGSVTILAWPAEFVDQSRVATAGASAAAIVLGALILEAHRAPRSFLLLAMLGDGSYSIYLTHNIAHSAVRSIWQKFSPFDHSTNLIAYSVIAIVIATFLGLICYWLVERPMTRILLPKGRDGVKMRVRPSTS